MYEVELDKQIDVLYVVSLTAPNKRMQVSLSSENILAVKGPKRTYKKDNFRH